jgi:hypothetical protein
VERLRFRGGVNISCAAASQSGLGVNHLVEVNHVGVQHVAVNVLERQV